jgi:hypothetical protein
MVLFLTMMFHGNFILSIYLFLHPDFAPGIAEKRPINRAKI